MQYKKHIKKLVENMVDKEINEGYYPIQQNNPISIEKVIQLWAEKGDKAYDARPHGWYPVKDLMKYREYNWKKHASRRSPEEWDELKQNIENNGFDPDNPVVVFIGKNGKAKIGEGNHRLAIANEINLKKIPVMFMFYQNVE